MDEVYHESQPIKYIVNPEISSGIISNSHGIVPTVGNATVYNMIGPYDRPLPTRTNQPKTISTHPVAPGFYGLATGLNPEQIEAGSVIRDGISSRPIKTEMHNQETPSYVFGDVSVDESVVQNAGQFDIPESISRDLIGYRTSFNSGGNILWPLGPRDGISTRVMQKNIVNLCK